MSVLLRETVDFVRQVDPDVVIDATVGLGGHSEAILETCGNTLVIGIDQDQDALELAKARLNKFGDRFTLIKANFSMLAQVAAELQVVSVDAVIADLGVSSMQLDSPDRGFSFRGDGPLDMRMDANSGHETAAELLERLDETEIANIIYRYGEERKSRRIARLIVQRREAGRPVQTTSDLAELVERAVGRGKKDKIHPATRTFQAIRIAVNNELGILEKFIEDSVALLKPKAVLCIITFHSLEDRIVKQTFQRLSGKCFCPPRIPRCVCGSVKRVEIVTRKPVIPAIDEINNNPRSRSAKLRVCRKLDI
jgi:16S rRNA (cytosine1402-N4)-methyltransferase